jgi:membrane protein
VLGLGVLATTGLSALTTGAGSFGASLAGGVRIAGIVIATITNIAMFLAAFRVLGARQISLRDLRLAAIVAGLGWQTLQLLGTYLVSHALKGSRESYGVFGLVLGLIAWIYLLALVMVLAERHKGFETVDVDFQRQRRWASSCTSRSPGRFWCG